MRKDIGRNVFKECGFQTEMFLIWEAWQNSIKTNILTHVEPYFFCAKIFLTNACTNFLLNFIIKKIYKYTWLLVIKYKLGK